MGLISKIEDKLSGSNKNEEQSKLSKGNSDYSSSDANGGGTSKFQNPISSAGGSSNYDSSGYDHQMSSASGVSRDGYGASSDNTSSGMTSGMTSSDTSNYSAGPRQPYDPYSRKGQQTAADAATPVSTKNYSRPSADDPSVARTSGGGIANQTTDQRYGAQRYGDQHYTSGSQPTITGQSASPPDAYPEEQTSSQHHYGRDAAMGAGALGAGGAGAYAMGKSSSSSQSYDDPRQTSGSYNDPSMSQQRSTGGYPQTTSSNPQDVSYMNKSSAGDPYQSDVRRSAEHPSMGGATGPMSSGAGVGAMSSDSMGSSGAGESGLHPSKKMGGAYEAGYRDAMEHMKAEMQSKGGSGM